MSGKKEKIKKNYKKPVLRKFGSVSQITLKTGSQADFGSNFFQA
ncbi:hypothetical protein SAMN06298216_2846 [Spirosomataceae bacterium TFI 002]|nr:hypothetical protein SAMN06298216_2846 [Spirosomataceae bacterium TFI 002]